MTSRSRQQNPLKSIINVPWDPSQDYPQQSIAPVINPASTQQVLLTEIQVPSSQPRRYFDSQALKELIESVRQHGILQPLIVRPQQSGGYELVAGERRYRAATQVGLTEVPVIVRELSDEQAWQLALIENLQREDLNPVEETEGILHLLSLRLQLPIEQVPTLLYRLQNEEKGKITPNVGGNSEKEVIETVFESLGRMKRDSFTKHRLPLLKLPHDVLDALRQGKLEYTKASAIAQIRGEEQRAELLQIAINENLSLNDIKEKIAEIRQLTETDKPKDLKATLTETYTKLKKSQIWKEPKKQARIQKLIKEMKALMEEIE